MDQPQLQFMVIPVTPERMAQETSAFFNQDLLSTSHWQRGHNIEVFLLGQRMLAGTYQPHSEDTPQFRAMNYA
jgi:hypothetical protein